MSNDAAVEDLPTYEEKYAHLLVFPLPIGRRIRLLFVSWVLLLLNVLSIVLVFFASFQPALGGFYEIGALTVIIPVTLAGVASIFSTICIFQSLGIIRYDNDRSQRLAVAITCYIYNSVTCILLALIFSFIFATSSPGQNLGIISECALSSNLTNGTNATSGEKQDDVLDPVTRYTACELIPNLYYTVGGILSAMFAGIYLFYGMVEEAIRLYGSDEAYVEILNMVITDEAFQVQVSDPAVKTRKDVEDFLIPQGEHRKMYVLSCMITTVHLVCLSLGLYACLGDYFDFIAGLITTVLFGISSLLWILIIYYIHCASPTSSYPGDKGKMLVNAYVLSCYGILVVLVEVTFFLATGTGTSDPKSESILFLVLSITTFIATVKLMCMISRAIKRYGAANVLAYWNLFLRSVNAAMKESCGCYYDPQK